MSRKRRQQFIEAVAEAARNIPPPKRRGRPVPANLTTEGRTMGLAAMHASTRCKATRKNGLPCKAAALRGATRCVKHGGRVEVPAHPHNIRRFFLGVLIRETAERDGQSGDREFWDALPPSAQREVAGLVSKHTLRRPAKLYLAARVWAEVRDKGYPAQERFFDEFARA